MAPQPPIQEDDNLFDSLYLYNRAYFFAVIIFLFVIITSIYYKKYGEINKKDNFCKCHVKTK